MGQLLLILSALEAAVLLLLIAGASGLPPGVLGAGEGCGCRLTSKEDF